MYCCSYFIQKSEEIYFNFDSTRFSNTLFKFFCSNLFSCHCNFKQCLFLQVVRTKQNVKISLCQSFLTFSSFTNIRKNFYHFTASIDKTSNLPASPYLFHCQELATYISHFICTNTLSFSTATITNLSSKQLSLLFLANLFLCRYCRQISQNFFRTFIHAKKLPISDQSSPK